jgi:hypothetical protein
MHLCGGHIAAQPAAGLAAVRGASAFSVVTGSTAARAGDGTQSPAAFVPADGEVADTGIATATVAPASASPASASGHRSGAVATLTQVLVTSSGSDTAAGRQVSRSQLPRSPGPARAKGTPAGSVQVYAECSPLGAPVTLAGGRARQRSRAEHLYLSGSIPWPGTMSGLLRPGSCPPAMRPLPCPPPRTRSTDDATSR